MNYDEALALLIKTAAAIAMERHEVQLQYALDELKKAKKP